MENNKSKVNYLDIVDKSGRVIGKDTRKNMHKNPKAIHPTVHILIINTKKEVLVHLRSLKKKYGPGTWEISAGGHVDSGEDSLSAA